MKSRIKYSATLLGSVFFLCLSHSAAIGQTTTFTQSVPINDSYVELNWDIRHSSHSGRMYQ